MAVLALDLGTHTGWALRHDGRLESGVQEFALKRGESPGMRFIRFRAWLAEITLPLVDAAADAQGALLAYEQAHHRGGAATEIAAGFTTRVQEHAARWHIEHVAVHSATLKKFVTGRGNADKAAVLLAAHRRGWLPTTGDGALAPLSDDEVDALALLHYVEAEVLRRPR